MTEIDPEILLPIDGRLAAAWQTAGDVLGLRVVAPLELVIGGRRFRYAALVVGFGTPAGALLREVADAQQPQAENVLADAARRVGYGLAMLSPALCHFRREDFVEFLLLLRWCGPQREHPPRYSES